MARGSGSKGSGKLGKTPGAGRTLGMPTSNPRTRKSATTRAYNNAQIQSVRVGDMRASAFRTRRNHPQRAGSWAMRFLAVVAVVALIGVGAVAVYNSELFKIEQVKVTGAAHLTETEVATLAGVPQGSTLLKVDTASIEQNLKANAWVESVSFAKGFPDTLEIIIDERSIAAVVSVSNTQDQSIIENWAIAKDGTWLMLIPDIESAEAANVSPQVHITSVPFGVKPFAGIACDDASVLNALQIVSGLSTELAERVRLVSATDTVNTVLTLDDGIQIAFGSADNIRAKERVCLSLMAEHEGQISYINVRVVDHPTWRSI